MSSTAAESVLPDPQARLTASTRLTALIDELASHPQMRPPTVHPTLYHVWDFANRTRYMLSELDTIAAGRPVQHPEQIPGYQPSGTPNPAKTKELLADLIGRSMMVDMILNNSAMAGMMGLSLEPGLVSDELKAKAAAAVEAVRGLQQRR
ncbi:hypothetical protein VTK56DRAFT_8484 [Thermocarpiscus australiensis]